MRANTKNQTRSVRLLEMARKAKRRVCATEYECVVNDKAPRCDEQTRDTANRKYDRQYVRLCRLEDVLAQVTGLPEAIVRTLIEVETVG